MGMINTGFYPTDTSTSLEFTLGTLAEDKSQKVYMYVRANGALSVGDVCVIDETFDAAPVTTTLSAPGTGQGLQCGVALGTVADNSYCWVQIYGLTDAINLGASCGLHTELNTTSTAGRIDDDATSGAEVVIGITSTATVASNSAAGVINYPIIGRTL